jgi:hypothetical protein
MNLNIQQLKVFLAIWVIGYLANCYESAAILDPFSWITNIHDIPIDERQANICLFVFWVFLSYTVGWMLNEEY